MTTTNKQEEYHVPVMLNECLDGLNINPDGTYVDVTFGGGGHSREIFKLLSPKGQLIVFDQDPDARKNAWEAPNFHFIAANFSFISNHLRVMGIKGVDGVLADLGVSSHQFDEGERGFSIRSNDPLDMRMNKSGDLSAVDVVANYTDRELTKVFKMYGELQNAFRVATTIVMARETRKIETTGDLMDVLASCAPKYKENRFFAQVFQALRIEVNQEIEVLERFLNQMADVIKPEGRLVVMSYHSLEDRLVKNYMKRGSIEGEIKKDFFGNVLKPFDELVRHPITPSDKELELNTRSRSAKLRIAVRRNGE
jgi:16S rRNA (cytosine1402-N4)-methyltransferase